MEINIKNTACQGTKFYVKLTMEKFGYNYSSFEMGEIEFDYNLSLSEIKKLEDALDKYGLVLIFTKSKIVSKIQEIILYLLDNEISLNTCLSKYIEKRVGYKFIYLNKCFKKETGLLIEDYYMEKKSEKMGLNDPRRWEFLNPTMDIPKKSVITSLGFLHQLN